MSVAESSNMFESGLGSTSVTKVATSPQHQNKETRPTRVRIVIHEVNHDSGAALKHAWIKIKVEQNFKWIELKPIENGKPGSYTSGESCILGVKDIQDAALRVKLVVRHTIWKDKVIGRCQLIRLQALLEEPRADKPSWYPIVMDGVVAGKVLMHYVVSVAQPEQEISVFVGTWNVGNAAPAEDLSPWLPSNSEHELVAIGAQECEYLPREPYLDCASDWLGTIRKHFGTKYQLVNATSRGQMRLVVLVRDDAEAAIMNVESSTEATGVGHVIANKGGVCTSLKFWDTGLCFVTAHLAAHNGQCDSRNDNYQEIVGNTTVGRATMDILSQFHHVFFFGDLNYRLTYGSPEEAKAKSPSAELFSEVLDKIDKEEYEYLFEHDELTREIKGLKSFFGFKEGVYGFPPTFKVCREEGMKYINKRTPAWCDRILWRSMPGASLEQTALFSAPKVATSDHKPVGAVFKVKTVAMPQAETGDKDPSMWHLKFIALKARGLRAADLNGLSDPYVAFLGSALRYDAHTKTKEKTLMPEWDAEGEVPELYLAAASLARLEHEFIMIKVVDYDIASADDIIGRGILPLKEVAQVYAQDPNKSVPFIIELTYHGLPAGTLEGEMRLVNEHRSTSKKSMSFKGELMERSGTFKDAIRRQLDKRLSKSTRK